MYIIVYDAAGENCKETAGNVLEIFYKLRFILLHHMELISIEKLREEKNYNGHL